MASLSSFMPPSIILLYIIWWTGEEAYRVVCAPTQVGCQYDMQYDMLQLPRGFLQPKDGRACGIFSKNQSGLERQVASVGQEGPVGEEKMESNCRGHAAGAPPPPPPSFVSGISDMHMAIIVTNPHLRLSSPAYAPSFSLLSSTHLSIPFSPFSPSPSLSLQPLHLSAQPSVDSPGTPPNLSPIQALSPPHTRPFDG